mmetsp:Transcript_16985/g.41067  ORF Transcript_16985/g.41067 Transcript_16985/m.41067 type:complete len:328 (+) Transcript_16985:250-1233(+)
MLRDDAAGHDEGGALDLLDRVEVVLDHGVDQRLVECVGRRYDDVQTGLVDDERAGARERVEELEGAVLLCPQLRGPQLVRLRLRRQQRRHRLLSPRLASLDDGRAHRIRGILLPQPPVQLRWHLYVVDAIHLRGPPAPCTTLRSLALILLSPGARTLLLRLTLSLRIPSVLHPRVSLRCVAPFRLRENRHAPHDPRRLLHHQLCKRTIRHAHRRRQPDLRLTSSHPLLAAARAACHALAAFLSCLHVASLLCSLYQCWRAPARRPARRHLGAAASFPRPIHPRPVHLRLNRRKPVHAGVRRAWGVARGRGRVAWADGSVDCRLRGLG